MGGTCTTGNQNSSETRGMIDIFYSSTSGTSKKAAEKLQTLLEKHQYIAPITNIGDYDPEDLLTQKTPALFLFSTYGNGDSPDDGEGFLKWIEKLEPQNQLSDLSYCLLAFGNSNFERHCGFALRSEKVFKACGAT